MVVNGGGKWAPSYNWILVGHRNGSFDPASNQLDHNRGGHNASGHDKDKDLEINAYPTNHEKRNKTDNSPRTTTSCLSKATKNMKYEITFVGLEATYNLCKTMPS
jgi:hypothetical protein